MLNALGSFDKDGSLKKILLSVGNCKRVETPAFKAIHSCPHCRFTLKQHKEKNLSDT